MDPKLCEAAMKGEEIIIKSQLPLDLLSQLTPNNNSVLHIAVEFNQTAFVKAITQHCPSLLRLQNSVLDTPLHVAARSEAHQDILEILINFAKSQTVDIENVQSGRWIEVLRMVNSDKDTALHCAARMGNERCVELLVKADPELCSFVNNAKESPLYLAAASGKSRALQFIIDVASPSTPYKGPSGLTALHVAQLVSNFGYKENKMLVDWRRQMITETDDSRSTPLHHASLYGRTKAVKLFLEFDSSAIYLLNSTGDSALHVAAFFGHVDSLKELINSRPDSCYLINEKGRTVLHAAVSGNQGSVVKFILNTPTLAMMINKPDKAGNTPLHLAALYKFHDMIKILAKCKSVLGIKNKNSSTALQVFDEVGDKSEMTTPFLESFVALGGMTVETSRHFSDAQKKLPEMVKDVNGNQNENSHDPEWEKRRSSVEANMIIGTLVATVSFAAGFTMPGGYISDGEDEGLATFTNKPVFQAFIVSNAIAFCSSTLGVLFHFHSSMAGFRNRHKYFDIAVSLIGCSLYAIFVAFCAGNYVVLAKSLPLSIAPMLILGVFLIILSFTLDIMRLTKLLVDHIWYLLCYTSRSILRKCNYLRVLLGYM